MNYQLTTYKFNIEWWLPLDTKFLLLLTYTYHHAIDLKSVNCFRTLITNVCSRDVPNICFVLASGSNSAPNSVFVFGRIVSLARTQLFSLYIYSAASHIYGQLHCIGMCTCHCYPFSLTYAHVCDVFCAAGSFHDFCCLFWCQCTKLYVRLWFADVIFNGRVMY